MAVLGIRPIPDGTGYTLPTEVGVTAFGLLAGIGGATAQVIASSRLSSVEGDRIRLRPVLIGVAVGIVGTAAGAFALPNE